MSILIGIGIVTTVTTFYLGRKGWHALHKAVGITPGVLIYQDDHAPLSLVTLSWEQLNLNKKHLKSLSDQQLRQLKRIDNKVSSYQAYQAALQAQHKTPAITEAQFVLNKMLQTRLPEMLATHYQFTNINVTNENSEKRLEASELLQSVLDNIEQRLDRLLAQMDEEQLKELRVMKHYINSHDS
ncbi:hypothetical protein SAMN05660405_01857 [Psychrobacter pacificensis]|uniref:5-bromo-4-chloroindolyl phosphate hydrolysis protein n=1 Tax=Psychrobacter pacificensis TaxID=112002 RepID=A0A1G6YYE0_9GAMM|nr:hypothetical protein [Psychrobacter pacificensis]GLR28032.1 hypothetical protein GCM10007915_02700 [Psychrobacter pacificensis]SDD95331.1 hypothetical protein SAMN05660405_01857 [Psychrobacter pacificensis]